MASLARRSSRRETHAWPGFVDALASLLMVIIFLVLMFSISQFFLSSALSGRDAALQQLRNQVAQLSDLLSLEKHESEKLRNAVAELSSNLQASVAKRDDLAAQVQSLTLRAETAEDQSKQLSDKNKQLSEQLGLTQTRATKAEADAAQIRAALEEARKTVEADRDKIKMQLAQVAKLQNDVAALTALKADLEDKISKLAAKSEQAESDTAEAKKALLKEQELSQSARAQVALLNRQMAALREQLGRLSAALDASEKLNADQKVQIASLGTRLNAALASKVQELKRYRSEFFGRLREVLGDQQDIRIVGDRFVFQSEVLFASGSAQIGEEGKTQLARLAATLRDIAKEIPKDIDWVLQVDGHTDKVPINSAKFPSNWELSTARAISVVRFLMSQGIPANRLAAAGYAQYQPLDPHDDEIAYRRNRRIELKLTSRE